MSYFPTRHRPSPTKTIERKGFRYELTFWGETDVKGAIVDLCKDNKAVYRDDGVYLVIPGSRRVELPPRFTGLQPIIVQEEAPTPFAIIVRNNPVEMYFRIYEPNKS